LWNQAGVEVTVDNCRAFAREVAKLRQFVPDNVHMARQEGGRIPQARFAYRLALARIGVGNERRADDSHLRLIAALMIGWSADRGCARAPVGSVTAVRSASRTGLLSFGPTSVAPLAITTATNATTASRTMLQFSSRILLMPGKRGRWRLVPARLGANRM
jgi:hypothetical protein